VTIWLCQKVFFFLHKNIEVLNGRPYKEGVGILQETMNLSDGRKLGFKEYGDINGIPVLLLHGTPGSRIWFLENDICAQELGIRLIATDRPGFGLSDKKLGRSLLDYSEDIKELTTYLGLSSFSVFGVSGGGAYAAALAHQLPEQIKLCVLVSTATPFKNGKPPKGMSKENRMAFYFSKHLPWLLKTVNKSQKKLLDTNPEKFKNVLQKGGKHLAAWDNRMLLKEEVAVAGVAHSKEAYRQGVDEAVREAALLTKDWGFSFADIRCPVHIWHGVKDTLSPVEEVKKLESAFSTVTSWYIKDAGHFLTEDDDTWRRILTEIKQTVY